jgi:trk system potassium uptake protein TrkH
LQLFLVLGLFGWLVSRDAGDDLSQKDGFIIITFFWVVLSIAGSIPFILIGMPLVDAFFESMSGITTTGATVISNLAIFLSLFFFIGSYFNGWVEWV